MSSTPAGPEQLFEALLSKFVGSVRALEGHNLRRYYRVGLLFTEFTENLDVGRYARGTSVATLVDRLVEQGVLADLQHPQRFLYYTKAICQMHPDEQSLMQLAAIGYTTTHAKLLLTVPEEHRPQVLERATVDGRIQPVRGFSQVVAEYARLAHATADEVFEEATAEVEIGAPATTQPAPAAPAPTEEPERPALDIPDTPALEAPTATTAPAAAANRPLVPEGPAVSPLKVVGGLEKTLTKLMSQLPDVFIALHEAAQNPYDSDSAQRRYIDLLTDIRQAGRDTIETLQRVLGEIDGEVEAARVPRPE